MKKTLTILLLASAAFLFQSCGKDDGVCKECSGCKTKATATLCEDDFEKASDYSDKIDDMVSDGCNCKEK